MSFNPQYPMYQPVPGYPAYNPPMMDNLAQMRAQQYAPQPQQPVPAAPAAQQNGGMNWVQGEEGAKAFLVTAGNSVLLLDSENPSFYIKSADQSGMPLPLRIFDYTERTAAPKQPTAAPQVSPAGDYVSRAEFAALEAQVAALLPKRQRKVQNEEAVINE